MHKPLTPKQIAKGWRLHTTHTIPEEVSAASMPKVLLQNGQYSSNCPAWVYNWGSSADFGGAVVVAYLPQAVPVKVTAQELASGHLPTTELVAVNGQGNVYQLTPDVTRWPSSAGFYVATVQLPNGAVKRSFDSFGCTGTEPHSLQLYILKVPPAATDTQPTPQPEPEREPEAVITPAQWQDLANLQLVDQQTGTVHQFTPVKGSWPTYHGDYVAVVQYGGQRIFNANGIGAQSKHLRIQVRQPTPKVKTPLSKWPSIQIPPRSTEQDQEYIRKVSSIAKMVDTELDKLGYSATGSLRYQLRTLFTSEQLDASLDPPYSRANRRLRQAGFRYYAHSTRTG